MGETTLESSETMGETAHPQVFKEQKCKTEKWCKCNQLPSFTHAIPLKFYVKNMSASLDQTLKRIDLVDDLCLTQLKV